MNHAPAMQALLRALPLIGVPDDFTYTASTANGELQVILEYPNGNRITITIGDYWRYHGTSCYFVNFNHPSGDLCACSGTPHVERAILDIGYCMGRFVHPKA